MKTQNKLKQEIDNLKEKMSELENEIEDKEYELQNNCKHKDIEVNVEWADSTNGKIKIKWQSCKLCGKTVSRIKQSDRDRNYESDDDFRQTL